MKDAEVQLSDFGTPEMKRHAKLKLEPRDVSGGGNVINTGYRNVIPDMLERLYDGGYLHSQNEPEQYADTRVANGRALQEMYQSFRSKGKDPAATEMVYRMMHTLEGHIGSERDIAETVYNEVLRGLREKGAVVYAVCIEGTLKDSAEAIRGALDALPRAMESAREAVKIKIENEAKKRMKQ